MFLIKLSFDTFIACYFYIFIIYFKANKICIFNSKRKLSFVFGIKASFNIVNFRVVLLYSVAVLTWHFMQL